MRFIATDSPILDVDAEAARGLRIVRGPITCIIEDHAYPSSNWAKILLQAYQNNPTLAAAGSTVRNANPRHALSHTNLLIAYCVWMPPLDLRDLPPCNHNVSYRTEVLQPFGD